jgi:hypothetical protein
VPPQWSGVMDERARGGERTRYMAW